MFLMPEQCYQLNYILFNLHSTDVAGMIEHFIATLNRSG